LLQLIQTALRLLGPQRLNLSFGQIVEALDDPLCKGSAVLQIQLLYLGFDFFDAQMALLRCS